ncbi:MAG: hypothetical protein RML85_11945 [Acidobacteriota bacterium]|nr:hypothetical protein [Acidobacteriota bacterium]
MGCMRAFERTSSPVIDRRRRILIIGLMLGLLASSSPEHFAQGSWQRVIGTGELPPPGPYEYRLSVMNNNGMDVRQGFFGTRVFYRAKWLGPVLRDHQINAARDVAFALAEETGMLRGAIFLREAATRQWRRIVQIGDRTPEGEVFTRLVEFSLNDGRQILFAAETSGPPPEEGIPSAGLFLADGRTIVTLLKTGMTTPAGTLLSFSNPRLTNDGRAYFVASVRTAQGAAETVIFRYAGGTLDVLARKSDPASTGRILLALQAVSPQGDAIAFLDQVERALYVRRGDSTIRVVRIGDAAPGVSGGTFVDLAAPVDAIFPGLPFLVSPNSLGPGGDFVFVGAFRRPNQQDQTFALYRYASPSGLQEIVRTGQSVGGFSVQFLWAPTLGEGGVIYCGAASQSILGGGILRFEGNSRQAQKFPGATQTEENLLPYAINRRGDAVYDHIQIVLNANFSTPTGPFDRPAFGLNVSLRLHTGSASSETLLGPVQSALPDSPFLGFSNLAANRRGDLLFIGNVSGGRHLFRVRDGTIELVAHQGQVIGGLKIRSVTEAAINDAGVIALQVETEDGSALLVRRGGAFQKVVASGDTVPGGRMVDIFDISLNEPGQIAFIANVAGEAGENVRNLVFVARPTTEGYSLDPFSIVDLSSLPRLRNAQAIFFMDVALADDGTLALTVRAPRDEGVILAIPRRTGPGYTFQKVAESSGATPLGGTFRRGSELQIGGFAPEVFSFPQINAQGVVSFVGVVSLPSGGEARALFAYSGGSLAKVVADGDPTPEGTPVELPLLPAHSMSPTGEIVFLSLRSGEPNLYLWRQGTLRRLIGARHPGPQGELLTPTPPLLAVGGGVVFVGAVLNADSRLAIYRLALN